MNQDVLVNDMIRTMTLPKPLFPVPVLILLVGPPAVGKTSFAKEVVSKFPIAYLSNEQVDSYLTPHLNFFAENRFSLDFSVTVLKELIRQKISVIYDSSVDKMSDRKKIKEDIETLGGHLMIVYFTCDDQTIFRRIASANIQVVGGAKRGFILDQDYYQFKKGQIETPLSEGAFEFKCDDDLAFTRFYSLLESKLRI